ncbi:hypothetical protein TD95_005109 [Thielaviopsis punctulata]|uniref:Uncharacterized protein n=1 Tax=Thielaviopsis punctulata TaxID=72032 RepID=A0A0F4Z761_9PEZI|nr:hypothetical protein TD95_005109 [Thielaviopsis punctulata]
MAPPRASFDHCRDPSEYTGLDGWTSDHMAAASAARRYESDSEQRPRHVETWRAPRLSRSQSRRRRKESDPVGPPALPSQPLPPPLSTSLAQQQHQQEEEPAVTTPWGIFAFSHRRQRTNSDEFAEPAPVSAAAASTLSTKLAPSKPTNRPRSPSLDSKDGYYVTNTHAHVTTPTAKTKRTGSFSTSRSHNFFSSLFGSSKVSSSTAPSTPATKEKTRGDRARSKSRGPRGKDREPAPHLPDREHDHADTEADTAALNLRRLPSRGRNALRHQKTAPDVSPKRPPALPETSPMRRPILTEASSMRRPTLSEASSFKSRPTLAKPVRTGTPHRSQTMTDSTFPGFSRHLSFTRPAGPSAHSHGTAASAPLTVLLPQPHSTFASGPRTAVPTTRVMHVYQAPTSAMMASMSNFEFPPRATEATTMSAVSAPAGVAEAADVLQPVALPVSVEPVEPASASTAVAKTKRMARQSRHMSTISTQYATALSAAPPKRDVLLPQKQRNDDEISSHVQRESDGMYGSVTSPPGSSSSSSPLATKKKPIALVDFNKPLPCPPCHDSLRRRDPHDRPVLKIQRIMETLSQDEIEKLFSGAPQFFARSEGHNTGAPHPSAAYPWDEDVAIRDLTDHMRVGDPAWSCMTAWPHIPVRVRNVNPNGSLDYRSDRVGSFSRRESGDSLVLSSPIEDFSHPLSRTSTASSSINPLSPVISQAAPPEKKRGHFFPRCREKPSMFSMQGLEKGTMGYQSALEFGVADALRQDQAGFDIHHLPRGPEVLNARKRLLAARDGLRTLNEHTILDQLSKNCKRYRDPGFWGMNRWPSSDSKVPNNAALYNELYSQILQPPFKYVDMGERGTLTPQIRSLVQTLAMPNVWIDFSRVEWRLQIGQLLWGLQRKDEVDEDLDPLEKPGFEADHCIHAEERTWLLVQILLACELLIRLDIITEGEELGIESIPLSSIRRFEKEATAPVKWSLMLARSFLENVDIVVEQPPPGAPDAAPDQEAELYLTVTNGAGAHERSLGGWLASLSKKMSLHHRSGSHKGPVYTIKGRFADRQVYGLLHFAKVLRWPGVDEYERRIMENCFFADEKPTEPIPLVSGSGNGNGNGNGNGIKAAVANMMPSKVPVASVASSVSHKTSSPSRRRHVSATLHEAGWLSKIYMSGIMLPGESLGYILMATLLENDPQALSAIGNRANLTGGFVWKGKSFWNTANVVGRVLAAGKGSAQCLSWVSSDVVPVGHTAGWVDVVSHEVKDDLAKTGKSARLWQKQDIEKESDVLGNSDDKSIYPADFIIPSEDIYIAPPSKVDVVLHSLETPRLHSESPADSAQASDHIRLDSGVTSSPSASKPHSPASLRFAVTIGADVTREVKVGLEYDINFVTAYPCVPSQYVRFLRSPSSPTIQQVDVSGDGIAGKVTSPAVLSGHPLHRYFTYAVMHVSDLLRRPRDNTLDDLLLAASTGQNRRATHIPQQQSSAPRVLVIDCITGQAATSPASAATSAESLPVPSSPTSPILSRKGEWPKMHAESRGRQFGSDLEMLVRAICAQKGWNALVSRRRRGCLACAIREAGALGWKVVLRVA